MQNGTARQEHTAFHSIRLPYLRRKAQMTLPCFHRDVSCRTAQEQLLLRLPDSGCRISEVKTGLSQDQNLSGSLRRSAARSASVGMPRSQEITRITTPGLRLGMHFPRPFPSKTVRNIKTRVSLKKKPLMDPPNWKCSSFSPNNPFLGQQV